MSTQTDRIGKNRYKLLDAFCQYDLGKVSQQQLENRMKSMKINPTQAYKSYMRKKCGNLKFNEFISALSISDDKIVNDMMNIPNHSIPVELDNKDKQETLLDSPHRSRAVGCFNKDIYRYTQSKDFLKWKSPKQIHKNDHHIQQKNENNLDSDKTTSTQYTFNQQNAKNSNYVQQILSPRSTNTKPTNLKILTDKLQDEDDQEDEENNHVSFENDNNNDIKDLCKIYCQGFISLNQFENKLKEKGIKLNATQQRIISKCRIDPNVRLSELLLAFPDAKYQRTGNFEIDDAIKAQREPLIFVDHPNDIITWKNDDKMATFNAMTRRKSFITPRKSDILTWKEISNEEYNEKVVRKKPPSRGTNSFHSNIRFDGDLIPCKPQKGNNSSIKHVKTELNHLKSTQDLLKWNRQNYNNEETNNETKEPKYEVSHIKYRRDDRIPYEQE